MDPNFFSRGSVSSLWIVTSLTDFELGYIMTFGQRKNSNCDRRRDLKNTQMLGISPF